MMRSYFVKKTIYLNAPAQMVWSALTDPEQTREYFFNCRVISDWKEGGKISFKGKIFWIFPIEMHGVIKKIVPGKLLQYTLSNGKKAIAHQPLPTNWKKKMAKPPCILPTMLARAKALKKDITDL